jgi:hypothetical protein
VATGKKQAKVKLFINGSHGDAVIKTVENVADNLYPPTQKTTGSARG